MMEGIELIKNTLNAIIENDKTEYDYTGKDAVNRNGMKADVGKRWATPRELALDLLVMLNKKVKEEEV